MYVASNRLEFAIPAHTILLFLLFREHDSKSGLYITERFEQVPFCMGPHNCIVFSWETLQFILKPGGNN